MPGRGAAVTFATSARILIDATTLHAEKLVPYGVAPEFVAEAKAVLLAAFGPDHPRTKAAAEQLRRLD